MKKKFISTILMLSTVISCIIITGLPISALIISDEGVLPFDDVKTNHWYSDAAEFCYVNNIINGMNEYTFAPNGQLTRAQFVTMLANIEGVDLTAYTTSQFTDVKPSHWYYNAVAWAYNNGIVTGTSTDRFSPNMQINRETLSRIMMLYMSGKNYSVTLNSTVLNRFTDKGTISSWAINGMKYMVSSGLISGMTETTVAPKGVVTRAQAARILIVFMQDYFYSGHTHSYSGVTCTQSAKCSECGMVNGLPKGHSVPSTWSCTSGAYCTDCGKWVSPSTIHHDFAAATCGKPKTCKACGITRGEPNGNHDWWAATCTNPKMCKVCYKTEGSALGHKWQDAATVYCTKLIVCTRCGCESATYGTAHNWKNATCTAASVCVRCNKSGGSALGHNYSNGYCIRCGDKSNDQNYDKYIMAAHLYQAVIDCAKFPSSVRIERAYFIENLGLGYPAVRLECSAANSLGGYGILYGVVIQYPIAEYEDNPYADQIYVYDNTYCFECNVYDNCPVLNYNGYEKLDISHIIEVHENNINFN